MAQEIADDSTKTGWSIWSYEHYRRLLEKEVVGASRVYAEVELADLPVSKGEEAKVWLTSAHQEAERAQEHIGERIKELKVLQALLCPATEGLSLPSQRRRARTMAIHQIRGEKSDTQGTSRGGGSPGPAASSQGNWDAGETSAGGRSGHWVRRDGKRPAKRLCMPAYTQQSQGRPGGLDQRVRHFGPGGDAAAF
jgi:hypothetical protein